MGWLHRLLARASFSPPQCSLTRPPFARIWSSENAFNTSSKWDKPGDCVIRTVVSGICSGDGTVGMVISMTVQRTTILCSLSGEGGCISIIITVVIVHSKPYLITWRVKKNYSVTNLRVAPPGARFAGYLSLLWRRYTQPQYTAHQSLWGNSNFEHSLFH